MLLTIQTQRKRWNIWWKMFAANNMTYQRKRAQEKKATRRAIKRAEVFIPLFCIVFKIFC